MTLRVRKSDGTPHSDFEPRPHWVQRSDPAQVRPRLATPPQQFAPESVKARQNTLATPVRAVLNLHNRALRGSTFASPQDSHDCGSRCHHPPVIPSETLEGQLHATSGSTCRSIDFSVSLRGRTSNVKRAGKRLQYENNNRASSVKHA